MVAELKALLVTPLKRIDIRQVVIDSINAHDADIVDLNLQQLADGKLATGEAIKPFYKPVTIKLKQKLGQPTDKVTLKGKSGKFYQGTYARPTPGGNTEIGSADEKAPYLERKYSLNIFGLSVPSREQLTARMKPTLQDNFKRAL
ncbi:hypothetical protein WBJ53_26090 [Spirosoma sp. SC4-14]|uniref:hypothetical protein n=1 Tax=Spirosoma sp. SC4-14 TaxID=3128900 RepID=UPI0030D360E8